jgi:hypothetical protein
LVAVVPAVTARMSAIRVPVRAMSQVSMAPTSADRNGSWSDSGIR